MTESERKKIIDLYESGMAVTQIQRLMAMTEAEFKRAVTELRASGDLPKRETNVTMAKVAEALASGETNPFKICEDFGISYDNFRKCKSKLGIKSGRPKRNYCYTDKALAVIADLKQGQMRISEIARKNGATWDFVYKWKKRLEADGEL